MPLERERRPGPPGDSMSSIEIGVSRPTPARRRVPSWAVSSTCGRGEPVDVGEVDRSAIADRERDRSGSERIGGEHPASEHDELSALDRERAAEDRLAQDAKLIAGPDLEATSGREGQAVDLDRRARAGEDDASGRTFGRRDRDVELEVGARVVVGRGRERR